MKSVIVVALLAVAAAVGDGEARAGEAPLLSGAVALDWSNCGNPAEMAGTVTSMEPKTLELGQENTLVVKGKLDKSEQGGKYTVSAKAGWFNVFSHSGDICTPEVIKLPFGLGQIKWDGIACPVSAGELTVSLQVTLSGSIPSWLARGVINFGIKSLSGDDVACLQITTAPASSAAEDEGEAGAALLLAAAVGEARVGEAPLLSGAVALDWSNCGNSAEMAGTVTSMEPKTLELGQENTLVVKGKLDKSEQGGKYTVSAKAGWFNVFSHSGDICTPEVIKLPFGLGQIKWDGIACPVSAGELTVSLQVMLSGSIPSWLARGVINFGIKSSSGDDVACLKITTAPASSAAEQLLV